MNIFKRIKYLAFLFYLTTLLVLTLNFFISPSIVYGSHSRIELLTVDNFAAIAGSAVTGTNTNVVNGDVGLDPTGGASITLLTCAEMVTGSIYDNNGGYAGGGGGSTTCRTTNAGLLTTAKNDLVTAYDDAAGRATTSTIATELGGTTLTDGTYDSAGGTFEITGTLTLDGQGNPDSVFIFKMSSTLITASSSEIVLTNGAQACNVYWQVGSSATLGTSSTLLGNVLALTSITDDGGSTVNGRLLARNGTVTLNNTTLTKQTCAASTPTPSTSSSSSSNSSSSSSSTVYPALNYVAPLIINSRRVDSDSIFISWAPYSGIDTFNIQYGLANGKWLYNTNVTGFSTTINALPLNQPIWVRVAARNDLMIGIYGEPKFVGGPALPNTGFNPNKDTISWEIPAGISVGILILLVFTIKKHRLSE